VLSVGSLLSHCKDRSSLRRRRSLSSSFIVGLALSSSLSAVSRSLQSFKKNFKLFVVIDSLIVYCFYFVLLL
jgi:F0F1-type ATP synthase membrane subunit c/vacuolar-type H+-ATPase subunit K